MGYWARRRRQASCQRPARPLVLAGWLAAGVCLGSLAPNVTTPDRSRFLPHWRHLVSLAPVSPAPIPQERRHYKHSVIPGGAYSAEELVDAIRRDPVVGSHYADFASGKAQAVALRENLQAHVSYRIGNKVYWTRNKVVLSSGETLLFDGRELARARCGNRVSVLPEEATNDEEPAPEEFDTPIDVVEVLASIDIDPSPVALPASGPTWEIPMVGEFPLSAPPMAFGLTGFDPLHTTTLLYPPPPAFFRAMPKVEERTSSVPEPASLLLLAGGLAVSILRLVLRPSQGKPPRQPDSSA